MQAAFDTHCPLMSSRDAPTFIQNLGEVVGPVEHDKLVQATESYFKGEPKYYGTACDQVWDQMFGPESPGWQDSGKGMYTHEGLLCKPTAMSSMVPGMVANYRTYKKGER